MGAINNEYDMFGILENRSVKCHLCIREKQCAHDMLKAVGSRTFNECFATDLETLKIIRRVNNEELTAADLVVSGGASVPK